MGEVEVLFEEVGRQQPRALGFEPRERGVDVRHRRRDVAERALDSGASGEGVHAAQLDAPAARHRLLGGLHRLSVASEPDVGE